MRYYHSKVVEKPFEDVLAQVRQALSSQGFGVLSDIDVQHALKEKLDADMPPYRILGACNPRLAQRALQSEPLIGAMLPCNVVVRQCSTGQVEVSVVDPLASMQAVENEELKEVAVKARDLLLAALDDVMR